MVVFEHSKINMYYIFYTFLCHYLSNYDVYNYNNNNNNNYYYYYYKIIIIVSVYYFENTTV